MEEGFAMKDWFKAFSESDQQKVKNLRDAQTKQGNSSPLIAPQPDELKLSEEEAKVDGIRLNDQTKIAETTWGILRE